MKHNHISLRHKPIVLAIGLSLAMMVAPYSAAALDDDSIHEPTTASTSAGTPETSDATPDVGAGATATATPDSTPTPVDTADEDSNGEPIAATPSLPMPAAVPPAPESEFALVDPDIATLQTPGELVNYWVRAEGKYSDNAFASSAVARAVEALPPGSRSSTEWDGLLQLAAGGTWASELRWQLTDQGQQVCLTQSPTVPLQGEIVIAVDQPIPPELVQLEVTQQPRDLAALECSSGEFAPIELVGVSSGERTSNPASRQGRASATAARFSRFVAVVPNPQDISALRLRVDPAAAEVTVTRVHEIAAEAVGSDSWTVAAFAETTSNPATTWVQASAPITATPGSELPATTKTSDVLFAVPDGDDGTELAEEPTSPGGDPATDLDDSNTDAIDESDGVDSADEDAAADESTDPDEESDDDSEGESAATDEDDAPDATQTETASPRQVLEMPDAGVGGAAGFTLIALTSLGVGSAIALLTRWRRTS